MRVERQALDFVSTAFFNTSTSFHHPPNIERFADFKIPSAFIMRACLNCQKRKSRCTRPRQGDGPCVYCARAKKTCSFDGPRKRTPLTRNNLDALENECERLRSLLRSMDSGVDVNVVSENTRSSPQNSEMPGQPEPSESSPQIHEWHEGPLSPQGSSPELLRPNDQPDGMATLAPRSSGYLGEIPSKSVLTSAHVNLCLCRN